MSGRGVGNAMVEQAFAAWLLRDFDVAAVRTVEKFLRPDDFLNPLYGRIYEAALEELKRHDRPPSKRQQRKRRAATRKAGPPAVGAEGGPAGSGAVEEAVADNPAPTADDLYVRLRRGNRWNKGIRSEQLVDVEIQCPRVVAPRDWARLIVEDAARRRVQQLSYRVEAAPQTSAPPDQLEHVRTHLQATLQQLQLADSRVNGAQFVLQVLDPTFDWRDALRRVEPAARVTPGPELTDADTMRAESLFLGLCLQHPEVGKNMLIRGEVMTDDLRLPVTKGVVECMKSLVHRDVPLNSVSVFRELLARSNPQQPLDEENTLEALSVYERMQLPGASVTRVAVLEYVARTANETAVREMRELPHRMDLDAVVVTDATLRKVTRATYAAVGINIAKGEGRPVLPPAPARRPQSQGPSQSAGR